MGKIEGDPAAAVRQYEDLLDVIGVDEVWERDCGTESCGNRGGCALAAPVLKGYELRSQPGIRLDETKTLLLIGWREAALKGVMVDTGGVL